MQDTVAMIGAGAMGTVCAILLSTNGHRVRMWGHTAHSIDAIRRDRQNKRLLPGVMIPEDVELTADDAAALAGATLVVSAVPTQHMRSTWTRLKSHLPARVPIVSVAKGIENDSLLRPTEILDAVFEQKGHRQHELAVLSGPNIAGELGKRLPGTAVVASSDAALAKRVQKAMSTQWFRVYTNDDVLGVELAGATKNIIAIAAGMLDGMGAGDNAKAALVTRGLVEIGRLGAAMGANPATFAGLAGLGDLITTCVSPLGRNRTLGEQIGKGRKLPEILGSMNSVAEGVPTTRAVRDLAKQMGVDMPITEEVYAVLFDHKDVRAALAALMTREPKSEVR